MSAGKGDKPRPVDGEKYRANYDAIFRKRKPASGKPSGKASGKVAADLLVFAGLCGGLCGGIVATPGGMF
jgi:hypothetical protein